MEPTAAAFFCQAFCLPWRNFILKSPALAGVVAQLVERLVRNEKVRGSNPLGSTSFVIKL